MFNITKELERFILKEVDISVSVQDFSLFNLEFFEIDIGGNSTLEKENYYDSYNQLFKENPSDFRNVEIFLDKVVLEVSDKSFVNFKFVKNLAVMSTYFLS